MTVKEDRATAGTPSRLSPNSSMLVVVVVQVRTVPGGHEKRDGRKDKATTAMPSKATSTAPIPTAHWMRVRASARAKESVSDMGWAGSRLGGMGKGTRQPHPNTYPVANLRLSWPHAVHDPHSRYPSSAVCR